MHNKGLETPLLFLIFNRPDTTSLVFKEIRKARPKKLFVAADGPRLNKPGEEEKCREARRIIDLVDWDCEVKTLFRNNNLGCKMAVSSAITWFFENVEEGIILEDDCLPVSSFFSFCQVLLEMYRYDERVMHISGDNFQFGKVFGDGSYYFSKFVHVWGWATWRRAWHQYDVAISTFPVFLKQKCLESISRLSILQDHWRENFTNVYNGKIDTWDYQWVYTVLSQNGLAIIPNQNLVVNIGFGEEATHTKDSESVYSAMSASEIINMVHPSFILQNIEADNNYIDNCIGHPDNKYKSIIKKIGKRVKRLVSEV